MGSPTTRAINRAATSTRTCILPALTDSNGCLSRKELEMKARFFQRGLVCFLPLAALGCGSAAPSPGVVFAVSGESLALTGYDFPPASPDAPSFVDGWKIEFDRILVTVDKI